MNGGTHIVLEEGWTPLMVYWNESDHAPREVKKACSRCLPGGLPLICRVVSPKGVAHETTTGDVTDCGHDCTGPEWWHRD